LFIHTLYHLQLAYTLSSKQLIPMGIIQICIFRRQ
jgi:hypothetical protein